MDSRHVFLALLLAMSLAAGLGLIYSCGDGGGDDGRDVFDDDDDAADDDDLDQDTEPPAIVHAPIPPGQEAGYDVTIGANVNDPSGIEEVVLFYRYQMETAWTQVEMDELKGWYSAAAPASIVGPPGVDYYIRATDASENANTAFCPEGAPAFFHSFSVICTGTGDIWEIHNGNPLVPLPMPRIGDKIAVQFKVDSGTFTVYQVAQYFIKWFGTLCSDLYSAHIYSDADDLPGFPLASSGAETVTEGLNCPNFNYHVFTLLAPATFCEGEKFWAVVQAEDAAANLDVLLDNGSGHGEEDRCNGYTLGAWFPLTNIAVTRAIGCRWP